MQYLRMPKRPAIARALLELLSHGRAHDYHEICDSLVQRLGVDESKLPIIKKTGRRTFRNEIEWVKVYLGEGKRGKHLIRQIRPEQCQILPAGLASVSH